MKALSLETRLFLTIVLRHMPHAALSPRRCQQDKFWILDSTPYYMKEAVRLTQADMEVTEVRHV